MRLFAFAAVAVAAFGLSPQSPGGEASALGQAKTLPERLSLHWLTEIELGEAGSNLLRPVELQQWSLVYDQAARQLCAHGQRARGDLFILAEKWPDAAIILPDAAVVLPWRAAAEHPLWDLPIPGLKQAASARAQDMHLPGQASPPAVRSSLSLIPAPVATRMVVNEYDGLKLARWRWQLLRSSTSAADTAHDLQLCRLAARQSTVDATTKAKYPWWQARQPVLGPKDFAGTSKHLSPPPLSEAGRPGSRGGSGLLSKVWGIISRADGPRCPHYPTCSAYCALAIRRHGLAKGALLSVQRLLEENQDFERSARYRLVYHLGRWRVFDPVPPP